MRSSLAGTVLAFVALGIGACDARPASGGGGGGTGPTTGSHPVHLTGPIAMPFACDQCHNARYQVTLEGSIASAHDASPSFDAGNLTCSNVYCHSGGPGLLLGGGTVPAPRWNPPTVVGCGACHALPGGAIDTSGWHPAVAPGVACALCHPGYTNSSVKREIHVNAVVNLTVPDLATNCAACHGDENRVLPAGMNVVVKAAPPVDRSGSSDRSRAGVGAHQAHLLPGAQAMTRPIACGECHVVPTGLAHVGPSLDSPATIDWGDLAAANGAAPSLVRPGPGSTSVTCSNVYCHAGGPRLVIGGGTGTIPTWNPPSPVVCGSCHALPGGTIDTSSWHPAIAAGAECGLCHIGYTRFTVNLAVHVNGHVEARAPDPTGDCAACHGDKNRVLPPGMDVVVKAAPPVDRNGSSDKSRAGVGAHQAHLLPGAQSMTRPIACTECHVVPTNQLHVGPSFDSPATIDWGSLAAANGASPLLVRPGPGSTSVTCSNIYCHAGGPGLVIGGGTGTTPTWNPPSPVVCGSCHALPGGAVDTGSWHPPVLAGVDCGLCHTGYSRSTVNLAVHVNGQVDVRASDPTGDCTACHGDANRVLPPGMDVVVQASPPVDRFGSSDQARAGVGAHQAHLLPGGNALSAPVACTECHVVPTNQLHVGPSFDTPASVFWGTLASANGASPVLVRPAPGATAVTCSNVYCHGGGPELVIGGGTLTTPTWNPPSPVVCGSCHALPGGSIDTSGWHPAVAAGADCGLCHTGYTRESVDVAVHVNGEPNVRAPDLTSNCAACHGDSTRVVPVGQAILQVAPPVDRYGSSDTRQRGVGAHQSHLVPGATAISLPVACAECHVLPANLLHVGPGLATPATLDFGPRATAHGVQATFDSASATCANYCHGATLTGGSRTQPIWTRVDGTQARCGTCHGEPPSSGMHVLHAAQTSYAISCGVCHPAGYSLGVVGPQVVAIHLDTLVELNPNPVPFNFTDWNPDAPGPNGYRGTATGCHGGTRYWTPGSGGGCQ